MGWNVLVFIMPGGGGGMGAIFGLDGKLTIVGCGTVITGDAILVEPPATMVSLIDSIEYDVTCSFEADSGEAGKKFEADLIGGSIGEMIGGGGIDESGFIKVDEASANGTFLAGSVIF